MYARAGDVLVVSGHHLGEPPVEAEVLEAHGAEDGPPFLVRWPDGRETLVYPSSDVRILHQGESPREPAAPEPAPVAPKRTRTPRPRARAAAGIDDAQVRLGMLEEGVDALNRQLEELREELRAVASVLERERPGEPG